MDTEIRNLIFDSAGDNTEYDIHRCAESDGDSRCLYGVTSWNGLDGHRVYFGKRVSQFGKDGCPNEGCEAASDTLKDQIAKQKASLAIVVRAIQQAPLESQKIELRIRALQIQQTLDGLQNALEALPCYIRAAVGGGTVGGGGGGSNPEFGELGGAEP